MREGAVMHTVLKKGGILIIISLLFSLASCSAKVEKVDNKYGREHVKSVCSSSGFGKGIEDDAYVALEYVYTSDDLKQKYGDSFEVTDAGGTAEWGFRLGNIYKGTARYVVTIQSDDWTVEMNKDYYGKWKVTDCYSGQERDDS